MYEFIYVLSLYWRNLKTFDSSVTRSKWIP